MNTLASYRLHESRVRYISVVYACAHIQQVKVSPVISDATIREIRREAKRLVCATCRTTAANKARRSGRLLGRPPKKP